MKRRHFLPILFAGLVAPALALETSYDADRILKEIQGKEFKRCIIKFKTVFADKEFEAEYVIYKASKFSNTQLEIIKEDLADIENSKGFMEWIEASYNTEGHKPGFTGAYLSVPNSHRRPWTIDKFYTFGGENPLKAIPMGDVIYYFNKAII